jgi:hypothetical protein
MFTFRPTNTAPRVRYFYLPANDAKPSEIIQVINSSSTTVEVPLREEDVVLKSFFERKLTPEEQQAYQKDEVWKVFVAWEELEQEQLSFGVTGEELLLLISFKYRYSLEEGVAA